MTATLYYTALEATALDQILTVLGRVLTALVRIKPLVATCGFRELPGAAVPCLGRFALP
jgi:hypothetical protein